MNWNGQVLTHGFNLEQNFNFFWLFYYDNTKDRVVKYFIWNLTNDNFYCALLILFKVMLKDYFFRGLLIMLKN